MQRFTFWTRPRSVVLGALFLLSSLSEVARATDYPGAESSLPSLCGERIAELADVLHLADARVRAIADDAEGRRALFAAEQSIAFLDAAPVAFFEYLQATIHQAAYARTRPLSFRIIHFVRGVRGFRDNDPEPRLRLLQDAAKAAGIEIPAEVLPLLLAQINGYRWSDGSEHVSGSAVFDKLRLYAAANFEKHKKLVVREMFDARFPRSMVVGAPRKMARREMEAMFSITDFQHYLIRQMASFYRSVGFFRNGRLNWTDPKTFPAEVEKHFARNPTSDPALRKALTDFFHHILTNTRGLGGEADLSPDKFRRNFLSTVFRSVYDWRDALAAREEVAREEAAAKATPNVSVWSFAGIGEEFAPVRRVRPRRVRVETEEPKAVAEASAPAARFVLAFTDAASRKFAELRARTDRPQYAELLDKTLDLLATNPKHPGLRSHLINGSLVMAGFPVRSSSVNNRTPEAYRVLWTYGETRGTILILRLSLHYDDL